MPKNNQFADDGLVKDFAIHARGRIGSLEDGATALDNSVDGLENVVTLLGGRVSATELFADRISSLENNVRISNNPAHPPEGKAVTYWVGPGVVWPSGVFWSTDPDNSVAPPITSRALVTLVRQDGITYGALGASFQIPDLVAPVWNATLSMGEIGVTSVTVVASALASDNSGSVVYEGSLNNGSTWVPVSRMGYAFTFTDLNPANTYPAPRLRARDAQGNLSGVLVGSPFTTKAVPVYHVNVLADAPLGFWPLDEGAGTVAYDRSGNGRDGAYLYSPILTAASLCGDSRAMESNPGSTETGANRPHMAVDSAGWMNPQNITMECLYKPSNLFGSHIVMGRWDGGNIGTSQAVIFTDGVNLVCRAVIGGVEREIRTTNNPLILGVKYHVGLTYNGTGLFLYLNGHEAAFLVVSGALNPSSHRLSIGAWSGASANRFQFAGVIDAPAFYGQALGTAKLRAHAMAAGL